MKTKDIEVGKTYLVRLTERQGMVYRGCDVRAKVVRVGFRYDVEYVHGSAIRGAPFKRQVESTHANGVEVEWEDQEVETPYLRHARFGQCRKGRAIVNARAVKFEVRS